MEIFLYIHLTGAVIGIIITVINLYIVRDMGIKEILFLFIVSFLFCILFGWLVVGALYKQFLELKASSYYIKKLEEMSKK